jgi:hypothetical protein
LNTDQANNHLQQINVFYLDPQNNIKLVYTLDPFPQWILESFNLATTHPKSDLAATWIDVCESPCAHSTIFIFQAPDGSINMLDRAKWQQRVILPTSGVQEGASLATAPMVSNDTLLFGVRAFINDNGKPKSFAYDANSNAPSWWEQSMPSCEYISIR